MITCPTPESEYYQWTQPVDNITNNVDKERQNVENIFISVESSTWDTNLPYVEGLPLRNCRLLLAYTVLMVNAMFLIDFTVNGAAQTWFHESLVDPAIDEQAEQNPVDGSTEQLEHPVFR